MAIRTIVTRGYGNGTFGGTIADVITRGYGIAQETAVTPRTVAEFAVKAPAFKILAQSFAVRAPTLIIDSTSPLLVPFLTDEAGAILTQEDDQPLIDESQVADLTIRAPTLKARKANT